MRTVMRVASLALLTAGLSSPAMAADRRMLPSITVVGVGEATARPDVAETQVGVVTQAPTAVKALKENSEVVAKLLRTLTAAGVPEKDLQTSSFSVAPQYRRGPHGEQLAEIAGYQVTNQVRVKVRQMALLGQVLDAVVSEGANQVQGISFSIAESSQLLDDARRKAMADARHRADLYAQAAGAKLGHVLLIQEQGAQLPRPFLASAVRAEAAVPVAPGEQKIRATVTVTFGIADKSGTS